MNWSERKIYDTDYFDDLIQQLKLRGFIQADDTLPAIRQISQWILDPANQVLSAGPEQAVSPALADKARTAFELCTELFPEEVARHFRDHAGSRQFQGLFQTRDLDSYAMWCRIAKRTLSIWHTETSWLHRLACALIRDADLHDKMTEAAECCRLGLSRRETLHQIETHHLARGSANSSAKSLLLLDLL